jgi:hypothetical protein
VEASPPRDDDHPESSDEKGHEPLPPGVLSNRVFLQSAVYPRWQADIETHYSAAICASAAHRTNATRESRGSAPGQTRCAARRQAARSNARRLRILAKHAPATTFKRVYSGHMGSNLCARTGNPRERASWIPIPGSIFPPDTRPSLSNYYRGTCSS